jgi:hypothetical protein
MRDGYDKAYQVLWLNVFGPELVEAVGRERMLSTPAHRVEALPNGAVLLVTWPTVADFASDETRRAQARAHVHLRPELDFDFDTVLRTLRERSARLAPVEPLVALMHTNVSSVFEETPESLTEVDSRFWFENFPEFFEREKIDEPAVGAYLGEVLVRNLGGQWLPRKKLGEAQVFVGDRVWLPMVRARRYMRSRQSLLDYSLTQLYRVAARHRS